MEQSCILAMTNGVEAFRVQSVGGLINERKLFPFGTTLLLSHLTDCARGEPTMAEFLCKWHQMRSLKEICFFTMLPHEFSD